MANHDLKCWPQPFEAMWSGAKWFEFRKDDRDFEVGDTLHLREWSPDTEKYIGRVLDRRVTWKQKGFGIPDGYCVLGLDGIEESRDSLRSELAAVKAENERMREAFGMECRHCSANGYVNDHSATCPYDNEQRAALTPPKPSEKPKCVCDHLENQHTRRSPIGLLGCASCSCLAYEGKRTPKPRRKVK